MRIMIKGGVWKNSEDEILKAAVMKYGLNNWSRVASLLVRKSSKQCKARWFEWLDPSIKKTEWTQAEEEKLLHLAKLFPCQWRTIAPIVGRTAYQCLEHYEKLLDQAQLTQGTGGAIGTEQDPRRLKPGEIDPAPETKPARPDAVDMDEDEKEMLSEARARLANTRGKKAKRKAREKQLEEARRLASLQKRRELKAAGITVSRQHHKKRKRLDLEKEIPFEQKAPLGYHEVGAEETPQGNLNLANISLRQMEGLWRTEEEKRNRQDDARKLKRLKEDDAQKYMEKVTELNDPMAGMKNDELRLRTTLQLPAPQLTDEELEYIVKVGSEAISQGGEIEGSGSLTASKQLLGSYQETPALDSSKIRTPQVEENIVMMEAQNAVTLMQGSTPLLGGDNVPLNQSDFSAALPRSATQPHKPGVATPHPFNTPGGATGMTPGATPGRGTPARGQTPMRDAMSLNEGSVGFGGGRTPQERQRQSERAAGIRDALASLPAPENEITVELPPEVTENIQLQEAQMEGIEVEDERDKEIREAKQREAEREAEWNRNTQVIKKSLPRPLLHTWMSFSAGPLAVNSDWKQVGGQHFVIKAQEMLNEEMEALVTNDAIKFPLKSSKLPKQTAPLEIIKTHLLDEADALLNLEVEEHRKRALATSLKSALGRHSGAKAKAIEAAAEEGDWLESIQQVDLAQVWEDAKKVAVLTYFNKNAPGAETEKNDAKQLPKFEHPVKISKADRLETTKKSFDNRKSIVEKLAKKSKKIEGNLEKLTLGYQKRAQAIQKSIDNLHNDRCKQMAEHSAFSELLNNTEHKAIQKRRLEWQGLVAQEKERQTYLQSHFRCVQADIAKITDILEANVVIKAPVLNQ
eukprot:Platyproteum_vivax@DN6112_c0_g1_i3.p1